MPSAIAQAGDRRRLSHGTSARGSLPWLDRKGAVKSQVFQATASPPDSSSREDLIKSPYPKGNGQGMLKQDPSIRAIGSVPALNISKRNPRQRRPASTTYSTHAPVEPDEDDLSPTQKEPARVSRNEASGISRAVTDLERLMKEAVQLAVEAAEQGRAKELTEVTSGATDTIHRASVASIPLRSRALVVDSDSDEQPQHLKLDEEHFPDSAVEFRTLPVRVTVKEPTNVPVPRRASVVSTPPHFYEEAEGTASPRTKLARPDTQQNRVQTTDWATIPRRRPTVPDIAPTPWSPRHANTTLVDYELPSPPRRRRTSRRLDIDEEHFRQPAREKRHYRNLDPAARGLSLRRKPHFSLRKDQGLSFGHHTRRQPIARKWSTLRKRFTAAVACINTSFTGFVIGVYAGEVPRIQYQVVDPKHYIILGNVMLFLGLALTTFTCWPLPLLHGRKPYTLGAFALVLPLQFPQAVVVSSVRAPDDHAFRVGLLLARLFTGLALGMANINFITTLLDLFGASLQSSNPHQELVIIDDVRRQGGGMGIWLGIWSWCFIGSIALGFLTGAGVIAHLNPEWGFYITCIAGAAVLLLDVLTPETRRSPYRRSFTEFVDEEEKVRRRIARGEAKLHLDAEGPMWWGQEVWAGIKLNMKMLFQWGFFVLASYLGWAYALVVLIIVLLGSLLSREYHWRPQYVGLGVFATGIGAMLAIPLSKAGIFSRDRTKSARTDSMTFEPQVTRSSHMVRRILFMLLLPLAGLAYTLSSPGSKVHWILPILFAALIGFLSNLAITECTGLILETFDTSDLQPGVNSRHRLESMASTVKRRRTNYSSFPRVTAGIFVAQTIGFLLAAAATGVGGVMTRSLGSQTATAITAAVLMGFTVLLTAVLWRFRSVQVVPDHAFGTRRNTVDWGEKVDEYWKPVVIGNPSGKMRRMSVLELGAMSRWTEIRMLNRLLRSGSEGEAGRNWTGR